MEPGGTIEVVPSYGGEWCASFSSSPSKQWTPNSNLAQVP